MKEVRKEKNKLRKIEREVGRFFLVRFICSSSILESDCSSSVDQCWGVGCLDRLVVCEDDVLLDDGCCCLILLLGRLGLD